MKYTFVNIINTYKYFDNSLEYVTTYFSQIDLIILYILTQPNFKDKNDEPNWEGRFKNQFNSNLDIYKILKDEKYSVTKKLIKTSKQLSDTAEKKSNQIVNFGTKTLTSLKNSSISQSNSLSDRFSSYFDKNKTQEEI